MAANGLAGKLDKLTAPAVNLAAVRFLEHLALREDRAGWVQTHAELARAGVLAPLPEKLAGQARDASEARTRQAAPAERDAGMARLSDAELLEAILALHFEYFRHVEWRGLTRPGDRRRFCDYARRALPETLGFCTDTSVLTRLESTLEQRYREFEEE